MIDLLADQREIVALDLPGFGASPMASAGTHAGIDSLTTLVAGFLDEIGLEHPHVAGNSLGGWISLELARLGRARSATGISPAGFHTAAEGVFQYISLWLAQRLARLMGSRAPAILARPWLRKLAFSQLVAHPERMPLTEISGDVRALADAPWFEPTLRAINREHFTGGDQIRVPVTIAWGTRTGCCSPTRSARPGGRSRAHGWSCCGTADTCRCPTTRRRLPRSSAREAPKPGSERGPEARE